MTESSRKRFGGNKKPLLKLVTTLVFAGSAFFAILVTILSTTTLTNFGGQNNLRAVNPEDKVITLALSEEPPQLDSTRATDQVSGRILGHVMEGLLRYDQENQLVPGMAKAWEIEGNVATFFLRDAVWSNGEPVTADDFIFSWRKALDPSTASQYAFILFGIKNARSINQGHLNVSDLGVAAVDTQTLRVELERPIAYFSKLMAFPTFFPINRKFYESRQGRYGADASDLLFNGPFTITKWVHGASIRLEKNSLYWDSSRIKLNVIDHAYITTDQNTTLNLFKDGKIATTNLNAENLNEALLNRWKIKRFADGAIFFIEINHRPERLTSNYNLRKALQLIHNPPELVNKIIKLPGYLPGESLFPVWLKGVTKYFRQEYPAPKIHIDAKLARQHLAIALSELEIDSIPPLVMLSGDNPSSNKQSEYYQALYKRELDIEVKIDRQIFKQRLAKMSAGDFDLVLAGWGPDYDDPLTFGDLFASWNANNRGRYNNPNLDAFVEIAQSSTDPKTRMDAMAGIQQIIHDDVVILPSFERGLVYVEHPQVKGVIRRAVGTDPDFTNAFITTTSNN